MIEEAKSKKGSFAKIFSGLFNAFKDDHVEPDSTSKESLTSEGEYESEESETETENDKLTTSNNINKLLVSHSTRRNLKDAKNSLQLKGKK